MANELINCDDDIQIQGIYKDKNNTTSVNMLSPNEHDLQNLIQEANNNTHEPMLYQLSTNKRIPMYENTLPIHRNIYDIARMEVYELHLKIHKANPDCELIGVKTYCLVYNNITNKPFTCTKWGGIKTCDVPIIHECTINQPSRIRTNGYELNNNTWNTIEWDVDNGYI